MRQRGVGVVAAWCHCHAFAHLWSSRALSCHCCNLSGITI
jgi:hypothetical protein